MTAPSPFIAARFERVKDVIVQRRIATDNFYAAERRAGVDPATAFQRAEEFARRFNELIQNSETWG